MRQSVVLVGVCAIVLLGAWLASRALVSTEATPGSAPTAGPAVGNTGVAQLNQQPVPLEPVAPPKERPEMRAMIDSARSGQLEPVVKAVPKQAAIVEEKADEEPSPFIGDSRELDYADRLMWEVDGGTERLTSARDVYKRCLESVPELQRCKDGLAAVELKLNPPRATVMQKPLPTLKNDAQDPSKILPRAKP